MSIGQWFSFQGRIRRRTWWLGYVLPLIVISVVATTIDASLGFVMLKDTGVEGQSIGFETYGAGPFTLIGGVLNIWGGLAGQVKRWHDRDKSGWWVLVNFIPLIGQIWAIVVVGFLSGTVGPNRFGPDPRA